MEDLDHAQLSKKLLQELQESDSFVPLLLRPERRLQASQPKGSIFRIMQWNTLAQGLSLGGKFVLCPKEVLNFDRRLRYIVLELLRYRADVICLEEVDMFSQLEARLAPLGYSGVFAPKVPSPCLQFPENIGPDGCAVFFDSRRLHCRNSFHFNLGLQDAQIALVLLLESLAEPCVQFYVVVTHLKAKRDFADVRRNQGEVLITRLAELCQRLPTFVCGDFNAPPDEPVIGLMKTSELSFASTYALMDPEGEEPEFTSWKFRGEKNTDLDESRYTIDYIWFQRRDSVQPLCLVDIPSTNVIGEKALPCPAFPSDHMSLVADFAIRPEGDT